MPIHTRDKGRTLEAQMPGGQTATIALAITLAIQAFASLASTATAVLAPKVAAAFRLEPKLIGVFAGFVYVGSMAASVVSGWFIERYGAIRVSQVCVLLCAGGVAVLGLLPPSLAWLLVLVPLIIGLGYGPITPASSQVLARTTSPTRMALTFSIKQTGVPIGVALGGAVLPALALALGWRAAFFALTVMGLLIAIAAQPTRAALDSDRRVVGPASLRTLFAPMKLVFQDAALLELSIVSLIYASTQNCLLSFLVVYLTEAADISLVGAGAALTVANIAGIVGRIGWGSVADRWIRPRAMLGLLGVLAGACAYLAASFGPGWSRIALLAVCAVFGATAVGWNGIQIAEVARNSPEGKAGAVTGASGLLTFLGGALGPPGFALIASLTGNYRIGFGVCGTLSLSCGLLLLRTRGRRRRSGTEIGLLGTASSPMASLSDHGYRTTEKETWHSTPR